MVENSWYITGGTSISPCTLGKYIRDKLYKVFNN